MMTMPLGHDFSRGLLFSRGLMGFSRGFLAILVALSVATVVAQDSGDNPDDNYESSPFGSLDNLESGQDESTSPEADSDAAPPINLDAPRGKPDRIEAYQARLAETDYMAGRLRVRDPLTGEIRGVRRTVVLVIQDGKVVRSAETGVNGVVQIKSLPVGPYAIVAVGSDGAAGFALEILPPVEGVSVPSYRFDTLIVPALDLAAAPPRPGIVPPAPVPTPAPSVDAAPHPAAVPPIPVALLQQEGEARSPVQADGIDHFAAKNVSSPLRGDAILVSGGNPAVGRIVVLDSGAGRPVGLAGVRVSFIREGQVLGTVTTDEDGYCRVAGLEEGVYSMVGFGGTGFIAMGIRVKSPSSIYPSTASRGATSGDEGEYVALLQPGPPNPSWVASGAPPSALQYFPTPGSAGGPGFPPGPGGAGFPPGLGGGGGMGGGFGGGGGMGGGGLLGALLGAGLGAGIGAAIAGSNDDDDNGNGDRPVSPFLPPQ